MVLLHSFYAAVEAAVDAAPAQVELPSWLEWPARRKAHLAADDLRALGLPAGAVGALPRPVLSPPTDLADVLGRLYVVEGSTLGGQVIGRHLRGVPGAPSSLAVFEPYGSLTGSRWRSFRGGLRQEMGHSPERWTALVAAARTTFSSLAEWCAPLAQERAA